jgi:hypothetical protein
MRLAVVNTYKASDFAAQPLHWAPELTGKVGVPSTRLWQLDYYNDKALIATADDDNGYISRLGHLSVLTGRELLGQRDSLLLGGYVHDGGGYLILGGSKGYWYRHYSGGGSSERGRGKADEQGEQTEKFFHDFGTVKV